MTTKQMAEALGIKAYELTRAIKEGMDYHRIAFKTSKAGVNGGQWIWQVKPETVAKALEKHKSRRAKTHPKTGRPKGSKSKTGRVIDNG
jgi:hypothetical protein